MGRHSRYRRKRFAQTQLSEDDLRRMFKQFEDRDQEKVERRSKSRWPELWDFFELVTEDPRYDAVAPLKLYDNFLKTEPSGALTHMRFLLTMRDTYGFEIANTDSLCDNDVLHQLNRLFSGLDIHSEGRVQTLNLVLPLRMGREWRTSPLGPVG